MRHDFLFLSDYFFLLFLSRWLTPLVPALSEMTSFLLKMRDVFRQDGSLMSEVCLQTPCLRPVVISHAETLSCAFLYSVVRISNFSNHRKCTNCRRNARAATLMFQWNTDIQSYRDLCIRPWLIQAAASVGFHSRAKKKKSRTMTKREFLPLCQ